jgi:hypothetical protein
MLTAKEATMSIRPSRRAVLKSAVTLVGGSLAARPSAAATPAQPAFPTVPLGSHRVSRLILGSNTFNGFCYSLPSLSAHMKEWFTPERIAETLRLAQSNGINTWQFSYYPSSLEGLKVFRSQGGNIQFMVLSGGVMKDNFALIPEVAKSGPLAIVHHGGVTDERFRAGQMDKVRDFLKAIRDSGVLVGLSTHLPAVVEYVDEKGWDLDFYMTCFYQFGRTKEELRKMLGEVPVGYTFLEGDPARMCRVIRQTRKTCLAFKILAAGRLADTPEGRSQAFQFAFENIKPQDAVTVGMYPRFKDEIRENAETVREICSAS